MTQNPTLSPYLNFSGNCREAMEFYQKVMGGTLELNTFGESGMPAPDEFKNNIMHATLQNDNLSFMASDTRPGTQVKLGDNVHLSVAGDDMESLSAMFKGLSEGGTVTQPLEKAPWGDTFGMFTDKFGINWMFNIGNSMAKS